MGNFNADAKQDAFAANMLEFKKDGFCVDIGSCHSIISNNTYFFCLKTSRISFRQVKNESFCVCK